MLHEVMYGYKLDAAEVSDDKVIVLDDLSPPRNRFNLKQRGQSELTDESCSEKSEAEEQSKQETFEESPKSAARRVPKFVPFYRVIVEVEDSRSVQSAEKSMEMFKPKLLILSNTPKTPGISMDDPIPHHAMIESTEVTNQRLVPGEKKVPLAPKNQSKRNFNFDKGFLADRSEKLVKAAPAEIPPLNLIEDQLTLRIGAMKTKNKQTKLNLENACESRHGSRLSINLATEETCERQGVSEEDIREKLREKDKIIDEMRMEITELNSKNKLLLSEVCDLRQSLSNLESQFNTITKSHKDLRSSEGNLILRHKVSVIVK